MVSQVTSYRAIIKVINEIAFDFMFSKLNKKGHLFLFEENSKKNKRH